MKLCRRRFSLQNSERWFFIGVHIILQVSPSPVETLLFTPVRLGKLFQGWTYVMICTCFSINQISSAKQTYQADWMEFVRMPMFDHLWSWTTQRRNAYLMLYFFFFVCSCRFFKVTRFSLKSAANHCTKRDWANLKFSEPRNEHRGKAKWSDSVV